MTGKEKFIFRCNELDFDYYDFWKFHFSNIYNEYGEIAEFIVAKALGINKAQNDEYWTLWDITYRERRIEVKATAYYHPWNSVGKVSNQRRFGITKANGSYDEEISGNTEKCRQNDIYVFCLNTGKTEETANPLILDNWEFYIIPTSVINRECNDNKTISLSRIKALGYFANKYNEIKSCIDSIVDSMQREV